MSVKKLVLSFWTCIYFLILSDRGFYSDSSDSHGFCQFLHFTGFFTDLSWKSRKLPRLDLNTGTWYLIYFLFIWKTMFWRIRDCLNMPPKVSVGAPTQVKWRVNLSAKTLWIVYSPKHCFKLNGCYLWTDIMLFSVMSFQNNHFEVI